MLLVGIRRSSIIKNTPITCQYTLNHKTSSELRDDWTQVTQKFIPLRK